MPFRFLGAPALCDRDLSGRGVYPGPRGTRGEPGVVLWDARSGGGTQFWVRQLCSKSHCQGERVSIQ